MERVRKAVIPAAGFGTRFLPASKAVPKELLPLVDKPAIQAVVEEAVAAGMPDVGIITSDGKEALAAHFTPNPQLEKLLEDKGDTERLAMLRAVTAWGQPTWIRQPEMRGLGHAIGCAEEFAAGEPFAVLLGDDLVDPRNPVLDAMAAVRAAKGGSVVLLLEVDERLASLYGVVESDPVPAQDFADAEALAGVDVRRIHHAVEKPAPGTAASNLAIIGRYLFDPAVFDVLRDTPPGRNGEVQITDAIATLATMPAEAGGGVHGVVFRGLRYDTGDKLEYLKAVVQVALAREDVGPAFGAWLRDYLREA